MITIVEDRCRLLCSVKISFSINGIMLAETGGVIDTGCQISRISINDMCRGLVNPYLQKSNDISMYRLGKIRMVKSVGVNDSIKPENLSSLSDDEIFKRRDICFIHQISSLCINGENIGSHEVNFAYRDDSPTLIGMNILKKFRWDYANGVFRLYTDKKSSNIGECIKRLSSLIFKDKMIISDVKSLLLSEFTEDCIDKSLVSILGNTYYEDN